MISIEDFYLGDDVDTATVLMPEGAVILGVTEYRGQLGLFAQVDDSRPPEVRMFLLCATGRDRTTEEAVRMGARYVGTVVMTNGLIRHVYDGGKV